MSEGIGYKCIRMVIEGTATEPTSVLSEYRLVNGDLECEPKKAYLAPPDFSTKTILDLFSDVLDNIRTLEDLV